MQRRLNARQEVWPLHTPFRISRGVKDAAVVVVAEVQDGAHSGVGECVPYARYGETPESVLAQIRSIAPAIAQGMTRDALQEALPPGAARNAVDCALWDLEAKQTGRTVAVLSGRADPAPLTTAVTVSLDTPRAMARAAVAAQAPLLKVKVSTDDPLARVEAVRAAAPDARLIVDPNESWSVAQLVACLPALAQLGVALIEQPIPSSDDDALIGLNTPVPICGDEAVHVAADLDRARERYQVVNIKLDKTGGLTEALAMEARAREMGFGIMIGCMVCTSLAISPALILTQHAQFADLDGPWWLKHDRKNAVRIERGQLKPPHGGWSTP